MHFVAREVERPSVQTHRDGLAVPIIGMGARPRHRPQLGGHALQVDAQPEERQPQSAKPVQFFPPCTRCSGPKRTSPGPGMTLRQPADGLRAEKGWPRRRSPCPRVEGPVPEMQRGAAAPSRGPRPDPHRASLSLCCLARFTSPGKPGNTSRRFSHNPDVIGEEDASCSASGRGAPLSSSLPGPACTSAGVRYPSAWCGRSWLWNRKYAARPRSCSGNDS